MTIYYGPPTFLILAAFLSALACGTALAAVLPYFVRDPKRNMGRVALPYVGVVISSIVFVGAGLETLGFYGNLGYIIASGFVGFLAVVVWGNLLREYGQGLP